MKIYIKISFVLFFLLWQALSLVMASDSRGQTENTNLDSLQDLKKHSHEDTVVLDGDAYTKFELVNLFLKIALSRNFGAIDHSDYDFFPVGLKISSLTGEVRKSPFGEREYLKANYPWLVPLLDYDEDIPRFFVVNKWVRSIDISLGMPNDLISYNKEEDSKDNLILRYEYGVRQSNVRDASQRVVVDEVESFAPILSDITGLPVRFVSDEPAGDPANISSLRIVLVDNVDGWQTLYKKGRLVRSGTSGDMNNSASIDVHYFRNEIERYFWKAVPYTRTDSSISLEPLNQVDGYFIPNEDNEIEFAICAIWDGHKPELIKKLVRECLVRSLGLPNYHLATKYSVLGLWNQNETITYWDGKVHENKLRFRRKDNLDLSDYPPGLSEFDEKMLEFLYLNEVEAGMSPAEVYRVLEAFP